MDSPDPHQLLRLFQKAVPAKFFQELKQKPGCDYRDGIYTSAVVVWLMIWQRLQGPRNLAAAVQHLLAGGAGGLVSECKRWREEKVSGATSGYCEARRRLPKLVAVEVMDRLVEELGQEVREGWPGLQRSVFVVDGTTLQLEHSAELMRRYSPGGNQYGENHWPLMQLVVFHDVRSGLALRPSWGAMYGEEAVSEQELAKRAVHRLPADAVVLGDGNFGIFWFAHAVQQSGRPMVLRLTQARAQKVLKGECGEGTERKVAWEASRWDRAAHVELAKEAKVEGRVIVCAHPARAQELLYLFTTLDLPAEEIVSLYGMRWNVETDLRSLKRTVGLHHLSSKSVDMVEKEMLLAVAAYNLVRAVMCLAARRAQLAPRQLSFSFVQTVVQAALPGLDQAATEEEYQRRLDRMLRYAAQGKLPNRRQKRCYPRAIWNRGDHFPHRNRRPENGGEKI